MLKRLIVWSVTGMLGFAFAGSAFAFFHQYRVNELYSNADGTIQFVELINGPFNGENFSQGVSLTVTRQGGGASNTFVFPSNLPSSATANTTVLLATQGFANLGIVTPDFIIQDGFLFLEGGSINLGNFESPIPTYHALPTDGANSLTRTPSTSVIGTVTVNSPKNFAGATGSISPPSDTMPDPFSFAPKTNVAPGTLVTSDPITVSGINAPAPISVTGGEYSVNGGAYTASGGTVLNADSVTVRLTASASNSTTTSAVLTIGGVSASFDVTTAAAADSEAPSVPAGLTANAIGSTQINLAWNAATDNVGVTAYEVFRDGSLRARVNAAALSFGDTGLSASTTYSYTVAACDAAGNCSAQSASASASTAASDSFTPALEPGFNLIGNSLNTTLDVAALFGNQDVPTSITPDIVSIWKWNAVQGRWAFYSPQLTAAGIASFAAGKGYEVLSTVNPGEGYWVNAIDTMTLPAQSGAGFRYNAFGFAALPSGFNLIATADRITPSEFNFAVSATPPSPGAVPTDNFVSLWAWDAAAGTWYFYSPLLEASGGLAAVKSFAESNFYLHFQDFDKQLGIGTGFWVNRP